MRKSERLFNLVTLLQGRRTAMTGQALAEKLGVGYRLSKGYDLPPLMFGMDEVTALLAGSRMVQAWTDPALAEAARQAEARILAVLTPAMLNEISRLPYRIPNYSYPERETHGLLRKACELRLKVGIAYRDMKEQETERTLWPLGLVRVARRIPQLPYRPHPAHRLPAGALPAACRAQSGALPHADRRYRRRAKTGVIRGCVFSSAMRWWSARAERGCCAPCPPKPAPRCCPRYFPASSRRP